MRLVIPVLFMFATTGSLSAQPPIPNTPGPGSAEPNSITRQYKDLIPDLIQSLQDSDAQVRQHAAMALAAVGADAIKPLTVALRDAVIEKRAAAAYALGRMGYE